MKSDSFTVDMESFSSSTNKDFTLSSRINLQRNQSRKGSQIGADQKKTNSNCPILNDGDRDAIPSPKASLMAGSMPEKLILVNQTTDHNNNPQIHHQITIVTGGIITGHPAHPPATKSNLVGKMRTTSFKQSSSIINPRRILIFFATLSSMGTILLICLTLSMAKYNEGDNSHATNLT